MQVAALAARRGDPAGEHALGLLHVLLAVLGMQQRHHRAALEVAVLVAGDRAQRAVDLQDAPAGADDRHADGALLEGGAEALLGLGQRALGLDALVHVAHDRLGLDELAGAVAHDPQLGLDPDGAPSRRSRRKVALTSSASRARLRMASDDRQVVGVDELVGRGGRAAPPARSRAPRGTRARRG